LDLGDEAFGLAMLIGMEASPFDIVVRSSSWIDPGLSRLVGDGRGAVYHPLSKDRHVDIRLGNAYQWLDLKRLLKPSLPPWTHIRTE